MADKTVSNITSNVNENKPIHVEFLQGGAPAVRSDVVAEHFNRSHKNVLRDIAKLRPKCSELFRQLNFEPTLVNIPGPNGAVRQIPAYFLTRDAFSLLVMGFTGFAAVRWKLAYIEAFNALEAAVLHNQTELAREAGYQQGLDEARALPVTEQKRPDTLAVVERAVGYLCKGLTMTDAAALTGCPASTLRGRLSRVRKAAAALTPKQTSEVTA